MEAKEEEEKDTESVDVDDGGKRLVAEDAEKEEESLRFFREFQTSRSARAPTAPTAPTTALPTAPPQKTASVSWTRPRHSDSRRPRRRRKRRVRGDVVVVVVVRGVGGRWARAVGGKHGGASAARAATGLELHLDRTPESTGKKANSEEEGRGTTRSRWQGDPTETTGPSQRHHGRDTRTDVFGADELAGIKERVRGHRMGILTSTGKSDVLDVVFFRTSASPGTPRSYRTQARSQGPAGPIR